jgi:predicted nucleic acid-binding protein
MSGTDFLAMGFPFQNQKEEAVVTLLCETIERLFVTKDIENQTVHIRKNHKIKLPDAIIAATALVHGCTLVTNNEKDFSGIKDLTIVNPYKI